MRLKRLIQSLLTAGLVFLFLFAGQAWGHGGHLQPEPHKTGILLVAFGSSLPGAQAAFDHIDQTVKAAFPDTPVQWAYTSRIIRDKLAKSGKELDSPAEALAEMAADGFTHVAVQSLHTIPGKEYHDLVRIVKNFQQMPGGIAHVQLGLPLLSTQADMAKTAEAILETLPAERKKDEGVALMGHGTDHPSNAVYAALMWQVQLTDENLFVGTVESYPEAGLIIEQLRAKNIDTAWLMPMMSVAGDHARNDMAGEGQDSWQSRFEAAGIETETVLKGTAEYDAFVDIWVDHLKEAMEKCRPHHHK